MNTMRLILPAFPAARLTIHLFLILSLGSGAPLFAKNYYVDGINGNDTYSGLTVGLAKQTIQSAAKLTKPGDTVFVTKGTYTATSIHVLNIPVSGTASAWIV